MQEQKVSVIMCTYNGAIYLREQLDTILGQTYPLFELLVFDDASEDDTWKVLEEYAAIHSLMKIYRNKENTGYAANFRQALFSANGDIIAISDQDDIWAKDKIEKMLNSWSKASLLVYCDSQRFTGNAPLHAVPNRSYRRFEGQDARKLFLFNTVSGHAILIRKELLTLALPFPDNIFYDWWFAIVAAYNKGVSYVNETLVFQRVHSRNVSVGTGFDFNKKEQRKSYKHLVVQHLKQFIKAVNMPAEDIVFAKKFTLLLEKGFKNKFYLPLFFFMVKHRNVLFYHKKKKVQLFSYVKHAYRFTFNYNY